MNDLYSFWADCFKFLKKDVFYTLFGITEWSNSYEVEPCGVLRGLLFTSGVGYVVYYVFWNGGLPTDGFLGFLASVAFLMLSFAVIAMIGILTFGTIFLSLVHLWIKIEDVGLCKTITIKKKQIVVDKSSE